MLARHVTVGLEWFRRLLLQQDRDLHRCIPAQMLSVSVNSDEQVESARTSLPNFCLLQRHVLYSYAIG
jgi:hypothetical protein